MNFLKAVFASICFCSGLGSAALAIPVQFTYTGNPLDLSVLEDWEQAWVEANLGYMNTLLERVEIVLELECDMPGGVWSCDDDFGYEGAGTGYIGLFAPWQGFYQSGDVTLVSPGTFVDAIFVKAFKVDATGQVVEWEFASSEGYFGGAGAFTSSHTGDSWGWSDPLFGDRASGYPAYFYCEYVYGNAGISQWNVFGNNKTCSNGEPVQYLTDPKIEIVGTGVWTVDTGGQVITTPLPAGLSLLLGGLGTLAWVCRRQPGRFGA